MSNKVTVTFSSEGAPNGVIDFEFNDLNVSYNVNMPNQDECPDADMKNIYFLANALINGLYAFSNEAANAAAAEDTVEAMEEPTPDVVL